MDNTTATLQLKVKADDEALNNLIVTARKVQKEVEDAFDSSANLDKYRQYISAKKTLDKKGKQTFEEYEKAKTAVEEAENDKRLKNYIDCKNKEDEKAKASYDNLAKLGQSLSLTLTAPLTAVAALGVKSASKIEDFTASFTTLLGSEPEAKQMIATINEMAGITPFDPDPLIQSTQTLMSFGIEAENVNDTLRMLGDSSKGSAETLQTLSTAYGRVAAKGKASMEELNMMINQGVPILGELAKVMGVAENEIIEMVSKGKVGFAEVSQAFENMTSQGGVFYKGMETASETLSGKLSTLKGNFDLLGASLMQEMLPTLKGLVDTANSIVKSFSSMGSIGKSAVLGLGTSLVTIGPILITVTKLIKKMRDEQLKANLAAMANPYILLASAVASVAAGLAVFISRQKAAKQAAEETAKEVKTLADAANEYLDALRAWNSERSEETLDALADKFRTLRRELSGTIRDINANVASMESGNAPARVMTGAILNISEELQKLARQMLKVGVTEEYVREELEKLGIAEKGAAIITQQAAAEYAETKRRQAEAAKQAADADKNSYEKRKEAYEKYLKNMEMLKSGLLKDDEKNKLEDEQKKLAEDYKKYKEYLDRKQAAEETAKKKKKAGDEETRRTNLKKNAAAVADLLRQQTDLAEQEKALNEDKKISAEDLAEAKTKLAKETAELEHKLNEAQADDLKELLVEMKANGEQLSDELENVYEEFFKVGAVAKEAVDNMPDKIAAELNAVADTFSIMTNTIKSDWTSLADSAQNVFSVAIANSIGDISKALLSVGDSLDKITAGLGENAKLWTGNFEGLAEGADKTVKVLSGLQVGFAALGQTVGAIGDIAGNYFKKVIQDIDSDLQKLLEKIDKFEEDTLAKQEEESKRRLDILKAEYAERGIVIQTGYETELELAAQAYEDALALYEEYQAADEDTINQQLELYKEALAGRHDEEIQAALQAKEIELRKTKTVDTENAKRVMLEKKAEMEKQKILEEAEKEKLKTQYEAELARVNAENQALKEKHNAETGAFYADMGTQIAQAWIMVAAGTVGIWAQCLSQLGPYVGPPVAAALTAALVALGGVQTGVIASQPPPAAPTYQALPQAPAFAEGVTGFTGGLALVGEEGAELVSLPSGSNVITNENTGEILKALKDTLEGNNGDGEIIVNVACYVDSSEIPIKRQLLDIRRAERYRSR